MNTRRMLAVLQIAEAHLLTTHRYYLRQDESDLMRVCDAANAVMERASVCAVCGSCGDAFTQAKWDDDGGGTGSW